MERNKPSSLDEPARLPRAEEQKPLGSPINPSSDTVSEREVGPVDPALVSESPLQLVSKRVRDSRAALGQAFASAGPFRHLVIDDFFENEFAEALLRDFPGTLPWEFDWTLNGDFAEGREERPPPRVRPTFDELRRQRGPYRRADQLVSSADFLSLLSEVTGIPDLIYDPNYFGGGVHEKRHGQELDSHIDYNYDPKTGNHRRLNLIVYLNKDWDEGWGGGIEIHSNPWDHEGDAVRSFAPLFNRAILFETNEKSWHGFPRIELPEGKRHLTRKSFTVYYFTRERPADEVAPPHSTFYAQRPLPPEIKPGTVLTEQMVKRLQHLIKKRDKFLRHHHRIELDLSAQLQGLRRYTDGIERAARLPAMGPCLQEGPPESYFPDGWVGKTLVARFKAARPIARAVVRGWLPPFFPESNSIELVIKGKSSREKLLGGAFTLVLPVDVRAGEIFEIRVTSALTTSGKRRGENDDAREMSFALNHVEFE
jgi:hypothetical protein